MQPPIERNRINFRNSLKREILSAVAISALALFITSSAEVCAQDKEETIRVATDLVLINVLVRDKSGRVVTGLKPEQFEVLDGGARRSIDSFSSEESSVSFGIIYDMHPTTAESTRTVIESLRQFKKGLKPGDDIFLVAFNMLGEQTFDFIPTFQQLEEHMADPGKREPVSLYDAVYLASNRIQSSRNRKRVLLIISDSADHQSRRKLSDIRKKVSEVNAEVFGVIFDAREGYGYSDITHPSIEVYPPSTDASSLDRAAIVDLADMTGGSTYFGNFQNGTRLLNIYREISEEMRSHYTLGFYPETVDEKTHKVRIKLRDVPDYKDFVLSYRTSYRNRKRPARQ